ncbi:DUF742 domain-containing protein [Prauserella cavernicola]|uniref:DUF742 domain-containing protein n=1 Tax=Prauserella cavernicola TaxID=2800127 RepID=A0A934V243_9PSEU|nr:DUF742 domain-containing protein [Prauserella cavernicola]MBK1784721.1 DUF742 domain-containing protein [Prauserella cavernicola]
MATPGDDEPETDGDDVGPTGARFPSSRQRSRFGSDEPEPAGETSKRKSKKRGTRVGYTGGRFPSAARLEKFADGEPAEPEPESAEPIGPEPTPEPPPPPRERAPVRPPPRSERVFATSADPAGDDPFEEHRLRVRPYVLTRGRTQASFDLAVETLISTIAQAPWDAEHLSSEYQAVRKMCEQPRSVAEVAALLSVPLGVARVLLSDLAESGLVHVHSSTANYGGRPDFDLMQRVLEGLHNL